MYESNIQTSYVPVVTNPNQTGPDLALQQVRRGTFGIPAFWVDTENNLSVIDANTVGAINVLSPTLLLNALNYSSRNLGVVGPVTIAGAGSGPQTNTLSYASTGGSSYGEAEFPVGALLIDISSSAIASASYTTRITVEGVNGIDGLAFSQTFAVSLPNSGRRGRVILLPTTVFNGQASWTPLRICSDSYTCGQFYQPIVGGNQVDVTIELLATGYNMTCEALNPRDLRFAPIMDSIDALLLKRLSQFKVK